MTDFNYYIYEAGDLIGGFISEYDAVSFAEKRGYEEGRPVDLVDTHTGEVINTYWCGEWDRGH